MAIKVAESMALRRAFDVAAPSAEERWAEQAEMAVAEATKPSGLAEIARRRAAAIVADAEPVQDAPSAPEPVEVVVEPAPDAPCPARSPWGDESDPCVLPAGHKGNHRTEGRESWT